MTSERKSCCLDVKKALSVLQPGGSLSQLLHSYEPRKQQQEMLREILEAFQNGRIALIEAETGIGKSIAYLIPAILWSVQSKERTLISTNTITLQEQLLNKDIPLAMRALDVQGKAVIVKGMQNYLCLRRLEETGKEKLTLSCREVEEVERIEGWAEQTKDGSLSDLSFTPSHKTWERIRAEGDACNYRKCPFFEKCHFFKARKEAQDAQLLVTNHSMLFADLVFRKKGEDGGGLLPDYNRVILDEAHNLEDAATEFFADKVSHTQLLRLMGKAGSERQGKLALLREKIHYHYRANRLKEVEAIYTLLSLDLPAMRLNILQQMNDSFQALTRFLQSVLQKDSVCDEEAKVRILPKHLVHPMWKDEIEISVGHLIKEGRRYANCLLQLGSQISNLKDQQLDQKTGHLCLEITALANRLQEAWGNLERFLSAESFSTHIRWIEVQPLKTLTNLHLINAKLDISHLLADMLFNTFSTTVLCSATMTTNRRFAFFRERMGIAPELIPKKHVTENIYPSPFNYEKQALLVVPLDMPTPNHPDFIRAVCEKIWQSVSASRGNAFVLFTSYSMLKQCHAQLASRFASCRIPLLLQGEDNRKVLVQKFKTLRSSVLFGTDSFWEGVDVAGEALRCVIIVKLPFKVPTEPMTEGRMEAIRAKGKHPFLEYTVPQAIVRFKQGFGRLIRHQYDRGCIVCLDSRLATKSYGRLFLNSLPPCRQLVVEGGMMQQKMEEFYKNTYHLTKKVRH
ncbi:MAG: helicase C-terminal domain-containing protein [Waddliaceae bacterium]